MCILLSIYSHTLLGQTCDSEIEPTTPNSDFIDHGDGSVTHTKTGLIWKVCSEGQEYDEGNCIGDAIRYSWSESLDLAEATNFAGHADWRVPNIKELASLQELSCYDPAINTKYFPEIVNPDDKYLWHWSSSPLTDLAYNKFAWYISFQNSSGDFFHPKNSGGLVRLVRSD